MSDSRAFFTTRELEHCRRRPDPDASLAGLLSAKEAFVKAAGALGDAPPYTFPQIEIVHGPAGAPALRPRGALAEWFARRGLAASLSISHTGDVAGAVVVLAAVPDGAPAPDTAATDSGN